MKITCTRDALNSAVSVVSRAVPSRSPNNILEGIYIKAEKGGKITLTGNDLQIGIEAIIEGDVLTPGDVVIDAKLLGNIIRTINSDRVSIEVNEHDMTLIKSGGAKFEIAGLPADGFPGLPVVDAEYSISLPANILRDMVDKTSFAVAQVDNNPILTGCLLEIKKEGLSMVALDGFRMAIRNVNMENDFEERKLIIPEKSLNELSKIIGDGEELVEINATQKHAIFMFDNYRMVTRLIEGEFINYHSVIPTSFSTEIECSTHQLTDSVQRASLIIISDVIKSPVKFNISEGNINISCATTAGTVDDNIPVEVGDTGLEIGFYNKYLLDVCKVIDTDVVNLQFNKAVNPLVVTPTDGNGFLYLILPLRLKAE
ncbi:MAG: DNA polymerase III subunit beta [Oscillospiraceae bacterium]